MAFLRLVLKVSFPNGTGRVGLAESQLVWCVSFAKILPVVNPGSFCLGKNRLGQVAVQPGFYGTYDSDSGGGRNETESGRRLGSGRNGWQESRRWKLVAGRAGRWRDGRARGYARAQAPDWTHGCLRFFEWPLRWSPQIFQRSQKALL